MTKAEAYYQKMTETPVSRLIVRLVGADMMTVAVWRGLPGVVAVGCDPGDEVECAEVAQRGVDSVQVGRVVGAERRMVEDDEQR